MNGMRQLMDDVGAFHNATDSPTATTPQVPPAERVKLRLELIAEEFCELLESCRVPPFEDGPIRDELRSVIQCAEAYEEDIVDVADDLADMIYVIVGTALEFGIPLDRVWAEVQRANMSKAGPDGKVRKREDGKVLKPDGWKPPDIRGAVFGSTGK